MRQVFFSRGAVIIVTGLWIAAMGSLWSNYQQLKSSSEKLGVLDQEKAKIASEVAELEMEVALAKTPEAQERIVRNELLMQKEGELVFQVIIPLENEKTTSSLTPTTEPLEAWQSLIF
jgi:cell division protein FtsB